MKKTERLKNMRDKYQRYIDNIEWDIKTNERKDIELAKSVRQISCYTEIVQDLDKLLGVESISPGEVKPDTF